LHIESSEGNLHETHLTPVLTPRVTNDPVVGAILNAPADDRDDVVAQERFTSDNAGLVLDEGLRIDTTGDGATGKDFLLHALGTGREAKEGTVLVHSGVGVLLDLGAEAAVLGESVASARDVETSALGVDMAAETLVAIGGACEVRVGGLVGNAASGSGRESVEPLVDTRNGATVAGADTSAVQDVLHREVDIGALGTTSDLDAISQGRDGAMSPAGATVLRKMLVAGHGAVVDTVLVAPGEFLRNGLIANVFMRARRREHTSCMGVMDDSLSEFSFVRPELVVVLRESANDEQSGECEIDHVQSVCAWLMY